MAMGVFSDRELDIVQYFNHDTMTEWQIKDERLVEPLFAHGCAITSLPDGRNVILTVGGFKYENLAAVKNNINIQISTELTIEIIAGLYVFSGFRQ